MPTQVHTEKLNKFRRMECIAITSVCNSTQTATIEAMLNLPPLHIFIQTEALATLSRFVEHEVNITETYHTRI